MKRLLDTDICVYIIKRKPLEVRHRFEEFAPHDLGVSSITVAELMFGAENSQRPEQNRIAIDEFLTPLTVMPFDYAAADQYGKTRGYLRRVGKPIGPVDTFIAAHALQLGVPLITNNVREFSKVPGLQIENWAEN